MEKELQSALQEIEKRFGTGSIMMLGEKPHEEIKSVSTSCVSIDEAIGVGGFPKGRVVEIYGPESSGKTTLALHVIAEAQKNGEVAALIDAEHALDPVYAKKLGVDVDNMLISQPDCGEQALEIAETLVRSGQVGVVVVDSVAALVPQAEINGEMGDAVMGIQARLMSQALRKLTPLISNSNTCFIFINQLRDKIGVMWGSPETTTGGKALRFYASLRIDIRRIGQIKDGDNIVGNRTRLKIVKNKVAPPFKEVEFDILYGQGISKEGDLLDRALEEAVITQKGAWFSFNGDTFAQGREKARAALKNTEFYNIILEEIKGKSLQASA